jgi:hypothetical protein
MHIDSGRRLDAWLCSVDALLHDQVAGGGDIIFDTGEPALLGKLWGRLVKERDLELHVRTGWIFGTEYVQLVDVVPSTGRHEHAVLVEGRLRGLVLEHLGGLHRYLSGTRPGA